MHKSLNLLLIEDSEDDALVLTHHLKRGGYALNQKRVYTAVGVQQALDEQPWDIIISDYNLPQFSGISALEIIKQRKIDVPFIIVSGAIGEEVAVAAMKAGAHDYVMKNNLVRLIPAIERELRETEVRRQRAAAEDEVIRQNRDLALLNRVIAATNTLSEPEAILASVCRELAGAFNVSRVTAARFDKTNQVALLLAQFPAIHSQPAKNSVPISTNPLYQYLINHKMPLVINPRESDSSGQTVQSIIGHPTDVTLMLLPLIIEDRVMGSINLETTDPRRFLPDEIRLAESVAHQVSGALARSQLDTARRLLTKAMEQTADSIIITDTEGNIVYTNPAFEKTTGYSQEEVIGQNTQILRSGKHDSDFYQKLWESIATGQVWHGRLSNKRKDGSILHAEVTISPVRNEDDDIINFVSLQRDITREVQLEEQYHQAQKMEVIGQLTAGVAHDFNNLLTAINGFASLLQLEMQTNSVQNEMLEKILGSGQRAADLVRQLLTFSRKQVTQPQAIELNDSVNNMHKMLQRVIGEDIDLRLELAPNPGWIKADPTQIEQVIMNLAVNARDAMPKGGTLTIATREVHLDTDHPAVGPETEPGTYICLSMSDTGVGMTEEVKNRIFEPFFTTKEIGQGTGLGLATVFGIVQQNDGNVLVYSKPDAGTTFEVYLPQENTSATIPGLPIPEAKSTPSIETILVVEDDKTLLDLIERILSKQGYTVLSALDSNDALQLVKGHDGTIDLLLTDVIMPGVSGKALSAELLEIYPQLKVIYMSGYTDSTLERHGVMASIVELLQKPFSPRTLIKRVRAVLNK